jgi:hypothetical protein
MLAELSAANAAYAVIKQCISNGAELASAGKQISEFCFAKEELQRKVNRKRKIGQDQSDLEEFMALESIKNKEENLKQIMIWSGRPGLWNDWVKFQADARKKREQARQQAEKKRRERQELALQILGVILFLAMLGGIIGFGFYLKQNGFF